MISFFATASLTVNLMMSLAVGIFGLYRNFEIYMLSLMAITFFSVFVPSKVFSRKIQRFKPTVAEEKNEISLSNNILIIIMGFSGCITINLIVAIISSFFPAIGGGNADISERSDIYAVIFMVISMAVFPAVFEEIGFRGFVMGSLKDFGEGFAVFFRHLYSE